MTNRITVDADALYQVLLALNGPHHLVLELQTIARLPKDLAPTGNPIRTLMDEYQTWHQEKLKNDKTVPQGS